MTEVHSFGVEPITCHAWNKERTQVALSHNNNEVNIYQRDRENWNCTSVLTPHDLRVTSIDWAPNTNRIVTCSSDRNAYVWRYMKGQWQPTLVLLRINRAATCVRWSPQENKFAVGSGARLVSICYFAEENDWWVSKHVKKPIKSSITCLDWHPNNILLVCGSTDFKTRIFSTYIKEMEQKPEPTVWGAKMSQGHLMAEFAHPGGGWIHSVSFSADGKKVAWVSHDSSISVVDASQGMVVKTVKTIHLPFLTVTWTSANSLLAAGYDCCPMSFTYSENGELSFGGKLDRSQKKEVDGFSAMRKFRDMDKRAIVENSIDTSPDTVHQNAINGLALYGGNKQSASKVSSTGMDGKLVIWDLKVLENSMSGLRIV